MSLQSPPRSSDLTQTTSKSRAHLSQPNVRGLDGSVELSGFSFYGGWSGIKASEALDFGLIVAPKGSRCVGVFTQNRVVAAPVTLSRAQLKESGRVFAVIVNSGNANACTGAGGMRDAQEMCALTARELSVIGIECRPQDIQVCSTGVIGAPLPMEVIRAHIPEAVTGLSPMNLPSFAEAIMTTDTRPKYRTLALDLFGDDREGSETTLTVKIGGAVKGAGMIHPQMATMLAFVCTDAVIDDEVLSTMWRRVCDRSFNAISIDGDTSTNDTALLLTSEPSATRLPLNETQADSFEAVLTDLCRELALDILRDGEGVEHVAHLTISRASNRPEARRVAEVVASSPLVKTAMNGCDPNWGRIIAAVGRSGVPVDPNRLSLAIGEVMIYERGQWCGSEAEDRAHQVMCLPEYTINIDLDAGAESLTLYTTDLSAEYVRINADYRS